MSIQRCVPLNYLVAIFLQFGHGLVEHPLDWWVHLDNAVVWHDSNDQLASRKLLVHIVSPRYWWQLSVRLPKFCLDYCFRHI